MIFDRPPPPAIRAAAAFRRRHRHRRITTRLALAGACLAGGLAAGAGPAAAEQGCVRDMTLIIRTGDDGIRGGTTVRPFVVTANAAGSTVRRPLFFPGSDGVFREGFGGLDDQRNHTFTRAGHVRLGSGSATSTCVPNKDIVEFGITYQSGGGISPDNWNLDELQVLDTEFASLYLRRTGSPVHRFTLDSPLWTTSFRPPPVWTMLDRNPDTREIVADDSRLYQRHVTGRIWRYTGTPLTGWEQLDANPATAGLAASGEQLYQRHASGRIYRYTGVPFTGWELIDNNPATRQILADGADLYQVHDNGSIWRYTGTPIRGWDRLDAGGAPLRQVAVSGGRLYRLHGDGRIQRWTAVNSWQTLDANPASRELAADGADLYQRHASGAIFKLEASGSWTMLDFNSATALIVASSGRLFQMHASGHVWTLDNATSGWMRIDADNSTVGLVASGDWLVQREADGRIWRLDAAAFPAPPPRLSGTYRGIIKGDFGTSARLVGTFSQPTANTVTGDVTMLAGARIDCYGSRDVGFQMFSVSGSLVSASPRVFEFTGRFDADGRAVDFTIRGTLSADGRTFNGTARLIVRVGFPSDCDRTWSFTMTRV